MLQRVRESISQLYQTLQPKMLAVSSKGQLILEPVRHHLRYRIDSFRALSNQQKLLVLSSILGVVVMIWTVVKVIPMFLPPRISSSFPAQDGTGVPLDSSIEVIFDRPMNRTSVEKSLKIDPDTKGSIEWEGLQRLIFKPVQILVRGRKYTLTIGGTSKLYIPLGGEKTLSFTTVGDPHIVISSPLNNAFDDYSPVSVIFDRPLIALTTASGSAERLAAFSINPPVPGEGRWLGTTAYQFRPSAPFRKATTYAVNVNSELRARDGSPLTGSLNWSFSSSRPLVEATSPVRGYDFASPTASVSAVFNQDIDPTSLDSHFRLLDSSGKQVTGKLITRGRIFGFYSDAPLRREETYSAVITHDLVGTEGPIGMEQDYTWNFTVAPSPRILTTTPENGTTDISEQNRITVKFRTPMDPDSFAGNVTVDPAPDKAISIGFYDYQNEHTLSILTYLGRSRTYTITISGNVKDQYGSTLGTPYTFKFSTAPYKPAVNIYPYGTYFGAFNQEIVPRVVVQTVNSKQVRYNLYKLGKEDLMRLYRKRYVYEECGSNEACRNWQNYNTTKLTNLRSWTEDYSAESNLPVNVVTQVTKANGEKLDSGYYFLDAQINDEAHDNMVMIVTQSAMTVKKSPNQLFVWAVNQSSGSIRSDMKLTAYDANGAFLLSGETNDDGVMMQSFDMKGHDNIFVFGEKDGDITVASSAWNQGIEKYDFGLPTYYNSSQVSDVAAQAHKIYLVLDRPIYRPGQKTYFKGVVRKDEDGDYQNIDPGQQVLVTIQDARGREVYRQFLTINSFGSFSGEFNIGTDAEVGSYGISAKIAGTDYSQAFQVEEYKKPDVAVSVKPGKTDYITGESATASINASYYFGSPVVESPVNWTVTASDYFFSWNKDYRFEFGDPESYWTQWWSSSYAASQIVTQGSDKTDIKGNLDLRIPLDISKNTTSQVMTVESSVEDKNNTSVSSSDQFIVHKAGLYVGIHPVSYSNSVSTEAKVELVTLDLNQKEVGNTKVAVDFYRRTWTTIRELNPDDNNYYYNNTPTDTLKSSTSMTTDSEGRGIVSYTPDEGGTYRVVARVTDNAGHVNKSSTFMWVSGDAFTVARENNDRIVLQADRRDYLVDDSVKLFVATPFATSSAKTLLTAERGKVIDYKVVDTTAANASFDMVVNSTWVPNVFIGAVLVKGGNLIKSPAELRVGYTAVNVSDNSRIVDVGIKTDKTQYKPRDTVKATITTKDKRGNPIATELAVGLVDKAVWDLGQISFPDIYKVFYEPRSLQVDTAQLLTISQDRINANTDLGAKGGSGGGCFTAETPILLPGGLSKPISEVKKGETILTRAIESDIQLVPAKVTQTFIHDVDRYIILNGRLRVTPIHRLWVNGEWKVAGEIETGDSLTDSDGNQIRVYSIENVTGLFKVYNLEVEKYHTFFAGNVFVHNQKGGFDTTRRNFPDTAYWNPHVKTEDDGVARLQIKLPDSLTTWRLAAIANNDSNAFGQNATEIISSRDVLIRPFLPRFLAIGDQAKLGGIIVNSSGSDLNLSVRLQADGLEIKDVEDKQVSLANGQQAKVIWSTVAKARLQTPIKITVKDSAGAVRDSLEVTLPIHQFSTPETVATAGQANTSAQETISLPTIVNQNQGGVTLNLSPVLGASTLQSMSYINDYPYSGIEQTSSKILSATYTLRVLKQAGVEKLDNLDARQLRVLVNGGVQRLNNSQHADGGWGWWTEYDSDAFFTAYSYNAMVQAKADGFAVSDSTLTKAANFLTNKLAVSTQSISPETQAYILYALRNSDGNRSGYATNLFDKRFELSVQARAHLATALSEISGMSGSARTIVDELLSIAKKTATTTHWEESSQKGYYTIGNNPSITAAVLEAIVKTDPKNPLISEIIRYLMTSRRENYWSSTYDTANVIQAVATEILSASPGSTSESYQVLLDGKALTNGKFESTDILKTRSYLIKMSQLALGQNNNITIAKSGRGNLYYDLNLNYYLPFTNVEPLEQGFVIERELINETGKVISDESMQEGGDAWVRLTLVVPEERNYVVIEDKLPAGLEAVNESLKNTNSLSLRPPKVKEGNSVLYFDHKEYRDDRVSLFSDHLSPGIYEVSYRVRSTIPGKFHRPPAQIYQIYQPDISGHSQGGWFDVTEK